MVGNQPTRIRRTDLLERHVVRRHETSWNRLAIFDSIILFAAILFSCNCPAMAVDQVTVDIDGVRHRLTGRIVVEAQDGGLLFEEADGKQWLIQADEIVAREKDATPFVPLEPSEFSKRLKSELGPKFEIHETAHYLIAYDTTPAFAFWVGSLYERLYRGFNTYWKQRKIELHDPEFPMVVLIFGDQTDYRNYASQDLGGDPGGIVAYYQMLTNRVVLFDITGVEAATSNQQRIRNADQINRLLSQPSAGAMVATIVHEATHQIAYNAGMQQRLADIPMWLNEGLAMFFETPDLRSRTGWRGIGAINPIRLPRFKQLLVTRRPDSLHQMLTNDDRFRNSDTALDAYAESWAMVYFLTKVYREEFADYLRELSEASPLVDGDSESRVELFKKHFGEDLNAFDQKFIRLMSRLK